MGDRKLKFGEIAETLKISEGSVFRILCESLGMRKLFSKWVPRLLKESERCLEQKKCSMILKTRAGKMLVLQVENYDRSSTDTTLNVSLSILIDSVGPKLRRNTGQYCTERNSSKNCIRLCRLNLAQSRNEILSNFIVVFKQIIEMQIILLECFRF